MPKAATTKKKHVANAEDEEEEEEDELGDMVVLKFIWANKKFKIQWTGNGSVSQEDAGHFT